MAAWQSHWLSGWGVSPNATITAVAIGTSASVVGPTLLVQTKITPTVIARPLVMWAPVPISYVTTILKPNSIHTTPYVVQGFGSSAGSDDGWYDGDGSFEPNDASMHLGHWYGGIPFVTYLRIPTSGISPGADIQNAIISFYTNGIELTTLPSEVYAYLRVELGDSATMTSAGLGGRNLSTSPDEIFFAAGSPGWINLDCTTLVQAAINGNWTTNGALQFFLLPVWQGLDVMAAMFGVEIGANASISITYSDSDYTRIDESVDSPDSNRVTDVTSALIGFEAPSSNLVNKQQLFRVSRKEDLMAGADGQVAGGNNKTAGTSLTVTFSTSTSVGHFLVLSTGADNVSLTTPTVTSVVDSKGNTWTFFDDYNANNSTAGSSATMSIWTCRVTSAHANGDTLTITFSDSITAKAGVVASFTDVVNIASLGSGTGSGTFSAIVGTVPSGEIAVGTISMENNVIAGVDTDTTNGTWSATGSTTTGGGAGANISASLQYKVTTGSGSQSWAPVTSNASYSAALVKLTGNTTVTPGVVITATSMLRAHPIQGTATILTSTVAVAADEAGYNNTTGSPTFATVLLAAGNVSATVSNAEFFARFQLNVPQGADIKWVDFTGYGMTVGSGTLSLHVTAEAADNPTAPTSIADMSSRTRTAATTAATVPTTPAYRPWQMNDIQAAVQAVVDRPGWVSGNYINIFISNNSSTVGNYIFEMSEWQPSFPAATLTVSYVSTITLTAELYENGILMAGPVTYEIDTEQTIEIPWHPGYLNDITGSGTELRLSANAPFDIEAVEWVAYHQNVVAVPATATPSGIVTSSVVGSTTIRLGATPTGGIARPLSMGAPTISASSAIVPGVIDRPITVTAPTISDNEVVPTGGISTVTAIGASTLSVGSRTTATAVALTVAVSSTTIQTGVTPAPTALVAPVSVGTSTPSTSSTLLVGFVNTAIADPMRNLAWIDPSFERILPNSQAGGIITRATGEGRTGGDAVQIESVATSSGAQGIGFTDKIGTGTHWVSIYMKGTPGKQVQLQMRWGNANGTIHATSTSSYQTLTADWARYTYSSTRPAPAANLSLKLLAADAHTFLVDDVQFETGALTTWTEPHFLNLGTGPTPGELSTVTTLDVVDVTTIADYYEMWGSALI